MYCVFEYLFLAYDKNNVHLMHSSIYCSYTQLFIYRRVPLKPDFLGAWKSVRLKHYPAYPITKISLIIQRNLATKIWAKQESGLTTVRLKRDPPVFILSRHACDMQVYLCTVLLANMACLWLAHIAGIFLIIYVCNVYYVLHPIFQNCIIFILSREITEPNTNSLMTTSIT